MKRSTFHLLAEQSVVIQRAAADIYAVAGDPAAYPTWSPGVIGVEPAGQAPAPGAVYRERIDVPLLGPQTVTLTVVDAVAPRLLTVDAAIPLLDPRFVLALRAIDDRATEVIWRAETRNLSPVMDALSPLLSGWLNRQGAASLAALQARLEPEKDRKPLSARSSWRWLAPLVVGAGALLLLWRRRS